MQGQAFLDRLEGVRKVGENAYLAFCPAHDNHNTQSLSIKLADRILLHCFGCSAKGPEVCEALGLDKGELRYDYQATSGNGASHLNGNSDVGGVDLPSPSIPLTLEAFAEAKGLPIEFLSDMGVAEEKTALKFKYLTASGQRAPRQRLRMTLEKGIPDKRFLWSSGSGKPIAYGLWRLKENANGQKTNGNLPHRDGEHVAAVSDLVTSRQDLYLVEGECLPGDAEVFTTTGWRRFDQYDGKEPIAQWSLGRLEFVEPSRMVKQDFDGELCGLRGLGYQATATPNHKLPVWHKSGSLRGYQVDSLPSVGHVPRCGTLYGDGIPLSKDEIALTLAISADASIHERKTMDNYYFFHLKKARKIERLCGLLDRLQIPYECTAPSPTVRGGLRKGQPPQRIQPDWRYIKFHLPSDWTWIGRMLPKEWLVQASYQQREFILAEMVHWDGNSVPNRNQHEYSSKHYENAVWMQTMAHMAGRCSTIIPRKNELGEWFKVSILHGKTYTSIPSLKKTRERYVGKIYCVTVPSGYFLVRQHGCISITGNSDALTLWHYGMVALGIPGASLTECLQEGALNGFSRVFIVKEADRPKPGRKHGGEAFEEGLTARLAALSYDGEVRVLDMEDLGCKDANEAHLKYSWDFPKKWAEASAKARKIELPMTGLEVTMASDIKPEKVEWLWDKKVPLGKITVFVGDPKKGKSFVTLNIAAQLSTGNFTETATGSTLIFSGEDSAADTIVPRLQAMGADLTRIGIVNLTRKSWNGQIIRREFNLGTDLEDLRNRLKRHPDVRLVIIDPFTGFMGDNPGNNNPQMRSLILTPLHRIAEEFKIAVILVTHFTKNSQASVMDKVNGTKALVAAARMIWAFIQYGEHGSLMGFADSNIVGWQPGLAFHIEETEHAGMVMWDEKPVMARLEEILEPKED